MEPEKQFYLIKKFLKEHHYLIDMEAMDRYACQIPERYSLWAKDLMETSGAELIAIENDFQTSAIKNNELKNYIQECQKLIQIQELKINPRDFHPYLKRKMTAKKEHEVKWLLGLFHESNIRQFVDIGSGAGHLSSALVSDSDVRVSLCLDSNVEYQNIGKSKLQKWSPSLLNKLTFKQVLVDENLELESFITPSQTALLGLHSCGKLSVDVLRIFKRHRLNAIASFGCCYHKLIDEYNLSQSAQQDGPLTFSNHALTMAAKSFAIQTEKSYQEKLRVKKYRYGLHFFCVNRLGKNITTIGNTHKDDANLDFYSYLKKYLVPETLKQISQEDANQFIESQEFQKDFDFYIRLGVIRALLGRVIEVYLLLDRLLWLKEDGFDVKLVKAFDRTLSPRNLGIIKIPASLK